MKSLTLFNHKGGVGKTTLTVNIAESLADFGYRVLLIDADPQCNLSSFYLDESELDTILADPDDDNSGETLWNSISPVVKGRGSVRPIQVYDIREDRLFLAPGDVLLADYEEELPSAWTDSFARKERGYDVMGAITTAAEMLAKNVNADFILYDVGPNIGPLNRSVVLGVDYIITPVAADLYSLRALSTVGRSLSNWIKDWDTVKSLASDRFQNEILEGRPKYLGYITSAFKVNVGKRLSDPHQNWEGKIAPRVKTKVVDVLKDVEMGLVPISSFKLGSVKHFQSLAPSAQEHGLPIAKLGDHVNSGYRPTMKQAKETFESLAKEIVRRMR